MPHINPCKINIQKIAFPTEIHFESFYMLLCRYQIIHLHKNCLGINFFPDILNMPLLIRYDAWKSDESINYNWYKKNHQGWRIHEVIEFYDLFSIQFRVINYISMLLKIRYYQHFKTI